MRATVIHKHKYIANPDITPEERVIAAAGKLENTPKGCLTPHLSETILDQLERIGTILKHERAQTVHPNTPRIPPNPPPPPHRIHPAFIPVKFAPTPEPLTTLLTSSTLPPPRVVTPPRVPPSTMAPPPRVVTPPTAAHQVPLRRSPRLADQRSQIEDEVETLTHNTKSHTRQNSSPTQEAMLAYLNRAQMTVAPSQLAPQKFPKEMLSYVLDENTGELMDYKNL